MKHGTGKQFEEQSRYTKEIWKRNRLRREQRDCPALNWLWISYRDVHATEKHREAPECHLYYIWEIGICPATVMKRTEIFFVTFSGKMLFIKDIVKASDSNKENIMIIRGGI